MPPSTENINNFFFQGLYKDVWKQLMHPALSIAECDFIQDVAQLTNRDKVLDIMCGHGRHAIELGRRGIAVTAIDNLNTYIEEIHAIAEQESLPVNAFTTDVLKADFQDQFEVVICMGNSFAFFDKEDGLTLLKKISAHLKSGGVFIINSWMIAEIAIKHFREREWQKIEEYKYLIENKFCFHPSRIESEHTVVKDDGAMEVINGVDYIFTLSELEEMFQLTGLTTKALFATPRKKNFSLGDSSVYIVVEKK